MQSYNATAIAALAIGATLFSAPASHAFCFEEAAARYNVAPQLVWGISQKENPRQDPSAVNYNTDGSYDYGLMQINTIQADTLRKAGIPWEALADPCTNVMAGTYILSMRIQEYGYTWKAVGAYHSKTPSKRDRYARGIAKILSTIKQPVPTQVASQLQPESTDLARLTWGQTSGIAIP